MAARRERERRRPADQRYRFTTPEPALETEEDELLEDDGAVADTVQDQTQQTQPRSARATAAPAAGNRVSARATTRPFSAYKDEYAYVYGDLRRVAAVIGGLLVALIVLYFVLPILAR